MPKKKKDHRIKNEDLPIYLEGLIRKKVKEEKTKNI